jgi:hypothetical protein
MDGKAEMSVRLDVKHTIFDRVLAQEGDELATEATLGRGGGAFHEEHDLCFSVSISGAG